MDSTVTIILKAGLALVTGWIAGAILLVSLAFVSEKAFAGHSNRVAEPHCMVSSCPPPM
jgi:hypothetical protein